MNDAHVRDPSEVFAELQRVWPGNWNHVRHDGFFFTQHKPCSLLAEYHPSRGVYRFSVWGLDDVEAGSWAEASEALKVALLGRVDRVKRQMKVYRSLLKHLDRDGVSKEPK